MLTLSYGFKKPQVPDQGGVVFPALEANWQQVNDHNHDGVNSALIAGLSLPTQTGNSGKFLQTNGVVSSWQVAAASASNVGGATGIFKQITGSDLEFKTIEAGTNITFDTTDPNKIVLNASGGGGGGGQAAIVAEASGNGVLYTFVTGGSGIVPFVYETELYDPDNTYNPVTGVFKLPATVTGTRTGQVTFASYLQTTGSKQYNYVIHKNGAPYKRAHFVGANNGGLLYQPCTVSISGVANDEFTVSVEHALAGNINVLNNTDEYTFVQWKIDPT
jgi:hypothetical protein